MADPRPRIPTAGDERETLVAWLDWLRATLRVKAEDLDAEQLDLTLAPSTMTLGGIVKHLAWVESWWFVETFLGEEPAEPWASAPWKEDGDWEWHSAAADEPSEIWALFEREVGRARAIVADAADLDAHAARASRRTGEPISLRWIVVHMIEEYARHIGHADLIRESIDGSVGL
jgi:uncharacterized damage-inducible protein DinB